MHLARFLERSDPGRAVAIVGAATPAAAAVISRSAPGARLYLIAQSAKELDALAGGPGEMSARAGTDFDALDARIDTAIVRVSGFEGKESIRRRLQSAIRRLDSGGKVVLLTHTKRGANTQLALLREVFGNGDVAARGGGGFRVLAGHMTSAARARPDDAPPAPDVVETIAGEKVRFATNAAVFSRERIDPGTRLLLETIPALAPASILDFGCGYGVMGIVLARRFPASRVTMIDIDVAAVELARVNAELNGVADRTRVVLSDGLRELPGDRFDLAVMHFPLHIPRAELQALLTELRGALNPGGCLYGVMLNAYELRPLIQSVFGSAETLPAEGDAEAVKAYSIVRACR